MPLQQLLNPATGCCLTSLNSTGQRRDEETVGNAHVTLPMQLRCNCAATALPLRRRCGRRAADVSRCGHLSTLCCPLFFSFPCLAFARFVTHSESALRSRSRSRRRVFSLLSSAKTSINHVSPPINVDQFASTLSGYRSKPMWSSIPPILA